MNILNFALTRPMKPYYWFEVPGEPLPWKRVGGRDRNYNPSQQTQEAIAWSFRASFPEAKRDDGATKYAVRFRFFHKRSVPGDIDNLAKNYADALQNVLWQNDKMIRELYAILLPSENPRTEIVIYEITDDYLAMMSET